MPKMKSKLGSIHTGKLCIGGFLDWQLEMNLIPVKGDPIEYKVAKWHLTANSYWLFDIPNKVVVKLYSEGKGYWEGKGVVTSQTKHLWDILINEPIEILGEGILEGKE